MFINKRLLIIIAITSIIILGALGFVTALVLTQSNANATTSSATSTSTPLASTTPHATANSICAIGAIQSIDTQNQTFTVTETKGKKTVTITANSQTTYHKRSDTGLTFNSLAIGQRVRVTSQTACDSTATTITAKAVTIVVSTTPASTPITSPTPTP